MFFKTTSDSCIQTDEQDFFDWIKVCFLFLTLYFLFKTYECVNMAKEDKLPFF